MTYTCPKCKRDNLLLDEVRLNGRGFGVWHCKQCDKEYKKNWQRNNPHKMKIYHLRCYHGIEYREFEEQLELQLNGCAICKLEFNDNRKPVVDHSHSYGNRRAILCYTCNAMLGYIEKFEHLVPNMIEYLKRYQLRKVS